MFIMTFPIHCSQIPSLPISHRPSRLPTQTVTPLYIQPTLPRPALSLLSTQPALHKSYYTTNKICICLGPNTPDMDTVTNKRTQNRNRRLAVASLNR